MGGEGWEVERGKLRKTEGMGKGEGKNDRKRVPGNAQPEV